MLFLPSLALCFLFFLGALILLWLCAIDLKLRLLPDELTTALAVLGILFWWVGQPYTGPWYNPVLGVVAGAGALALVRGVANKIYGFETMGLGDIKLMGAVGIWLGLEGAVASLCAGAVMGLLHGIALIVYGKLKHGKDEKFREMTIPAGPGFCAGAALVCIYHYHTLPLFGAG